MGAVACKLQLCKSVCGQQLLLLPVEALPPLASSALSAKLDAPELAKQWTRQPPLLLMPLPLFRFESLFGRQSLDLARPS